MSNKGQTLVETTLALPFVIFLFMGKILLLLYFLSYFFCSYHVHEAAFCQISKTEHQCKMIFMRQIQKVRTVKLLQYQVFKNSQDLELKTEFSFPLLNFLTPFKVSRKVSLKQWQ